MKPWSHPKLEKLNVVLTQGGNVGWSADVDIPANTCFKGKQQECDS